MQNDFEISQINHEIRWIEEKMEKVKQEMIRRPSKIRHLNDLLRQKNERLERIKKLS
jgi:predicted  nucleic acid-binding Zn-ribbon protein